MPFQHRDARPRHLRSAPHRVRPRPLTPHPRCPSNGGNLNAEKGGRVNALYQGPLYERPDPTTWHRPEMLAAVTNRDITNVFRLLQKIGMSQQRIAALTGQSQPEVSAILHGR